MGMATDRKSLRAVRLFPEDIESVESLAAKANVTWSAMLRTLLREALNARKK